MIRKFIIVLAAFAMILGGFGPLSSVTLGATEASGERTAMSDCASMMEMKASHDSMDCSSNDTDNENSSMKCPADNCTLRCGTVSVEAAVSLVHHHMAGGVPELLPDFQVYASTAGKPPLRPPCSSILA